MPVTEDAKRLVDYCQENLGDPDLWHTPEGYPGSLALCIIDSLYSTGSHYSSVVNVVSRYQEKHGWGDGARALLDSIEKAGGARGWAESVAGNLKPAHTKPGAVLKADVIEQAATLMEGLGIDTVPDLQAAVRESPQDNPVYDGWRSLPSQSSGVTYNYLLMLAGMPSVKPDRMVLRFLATALGEDTDLSKDRAVELVEVAAAQIGVNVRALYHIIWRAASGRELVD